MFRTHTERYQLYQSNMTEAQVVEAFKEKYDALPTEPPYLFGEWHVGPVSDEQYRQMLKRRQQKEEA